MHARRRTHLSGHLHLQLCCNCNIRTIETKTDDDAMRLQWASVSGCVCAAGHNYQHLIQVSRERETFSAIESLKRPSLTYSNNMYFVHTISWNETNSAMHLADAKQYTAKTNWFCIRTTSCLSRRKTCFHFVCCSTASILYAIESRRIRRGRCQQANCMRMILSLSHSH